MKQDGPIVIINDDLEEQEILKIAYEELDYKNKLLFISSPLEAVEYLKRLDVNSFIVTSDINMPLMDGFSLRQIVFNNEHLREKCFPYLLLTNGASPDTIAKASFEKSLIWLRPLLC